jgi:hypothetical protein
MKSIPIAVLALALALSGCSSSPSLEEQRKLVDYDNCIQFEIARANQMSQTSGRSTKIPFLSGQPESFDFSHRYTNFVEYSEILSRCKNYLP